MKLRSNKGFSLVELIIVIAILGIIALIAVPNLTGIQQRSQVNADIRTAETIAKALTIAVAESRTVKVGADTKYLDAALDAAWYDLSAIETSITGMDFDEYVDTQLAPKSTTNGKYWVKRIGNRIVVAVATGTPTDFSANPYDANADGGSVNAEIACINGMELTVANIASLSL